jgi:hypothetical protein
MFILLSFTYRRVGLIELTKSLCCVVRHVQSSDNVTYIRKSENSISQQFHETTQRLCFHARRGYQCDIPHQFCEESALEMSQILMRYSNILTQSPPSLSCWMKLDTLNLLGLYFLRRRSRTNNKAVQAVPSTSPHWSRGKRKKHVERVDSGQSSFARS